MQYRAVNNRCASTLDSLLTISPDALTILQKEGWNIITIDIVALARSCIQNSQYRRSARPSEAPLVMDCSSFIKWLYGNRGIWLPRRSVQQHRLGEDIELKNIIAGDVVFTSGWINYYEEDPNLGIGHVGIATNSNTIVHAANKKAGVIESSLHDFIGKNEFRGIRRYIPKGVEVLTLEAPPKRDIEISDDLRWIIRQSLPKHNTGGT